MHPLSVISSTKYLWEVHGKLPIAHRDGKHLMKFAEDAGVWFGISPGTRKELLVASIINQTHCLSGLCRETITLYVAG